MPTKTEIIEAGANCADCGHHKDLHAPRRKKPNNSCAHYEETYPRNKVWCRCYGYVSPVIRAGADSIAELFWSREPTHDQIAEAALSAMLPLIKDQLAAEVRGVGSTQTISPLADTGAVALGLAEVRGLERGLNQAAQLIEEYEL